MRGVDRERIGLVAVSFSIRQPRARASIAVSNGSSAGRSWCANVAPAIQDSGARQWRRALRSIKIASMTRTSRPNAPPAPAARATPWPTWIGIGAMAAMARLPWGLQRGLGRGSAACCGLCLAPPHRRPQSRTVFPRTGSGRRARCCARTSRRWASAMFEFARAWWGSIAPMRGAAWSSKAWNTSRPRARAVAASSSSRATSPPGDLRPPDVTTCRSPACTDHTREPVMEWAVKRGRLRYAAAMFTKQGVRPAVKHLKQGGLLWYAPDQDPSRGDSVYVPFFGRPANSLASTHQLRACRGRQWCVPACASPRWRIHAAHPAGARGHSVAGRDGRHRAGDGRDRIHGARAPTRVPVDPSPLQATTGW